MHAGEPHPLPHACVASVEITRVMKAMLQWLGSHDLARFFVEDVDLRRFRRYKRVSWGKMSAERRWSISNSVP